MHRIVIYNITILLSIGLISHINNAYADRNIDYWSKINQSTSNNKSYINTCSLNDLRSPININKVLVKPFAPLNIKYTKIPITIINKKFHLEMESYEREKITIDNNDEYFLKKIKIITNSEHRINNNIFPLEIQFIHTSNKHNRFLVLSVFGEYSKTTHHSLQKIISRIPTMEEYRRGYSALINLNKIIENTDEYFRYNGTLTSKSCDDAIWLIIKKPIKVTKKQIKLIRSKLAQNLYRNNRNIIQPINNRLIKYYTKQYQYIKKD
ncbi:MAG: carbonic anhydrase family protein [Anaplasmataceae bacterium]|nr:carbonic anhydrase family protein [Anaplasmataceae bacterium]